jgi:hypothetical protein
MHRILFVLSIVVASLVSRPLAAQQARWVRPSASGPEEIDLSSIRAFHRAGKDAVVVWMRKAGTPSDLTDDGRHVSRVSYGYIFRCADAEIALRTIVAYDSTGAMMEGSQTLEDASVQFSPILPETIAAEWMRVACREARRRRLIR